MENLGLNTEPLSTSPQHQTGHHYQDIYFRIIIKILVVFIMTTDERTYTNGKQKSAAFVLQ